MAFTPPPTPPNSGDPANFNDNSDVFFGWIPGFVAELNAVGFPEIPTLAPNGSASLPAFSFASDPDTGVYRIGANVLGFSAGGSERVRVTTGGMQVTGLLTGTAVTQSPTDTTAGRVTKPGDFGIGGNLPAVPGGNIAATDGSIPPGQYAYDTAVGHVGGPTGVVTGALRHARRTSSGGEAQSLIAEEPSSLRGTVYTRGRSLGVWSTFRRHFDTGNLLGAVSQSAGVPTGAVIERGSNANGSYVRFADGTQICWRVENHTDLAFTAFGNIFSSDNIVPGDWAAAFSASFPVSVATDFRGTNNTRIWGASAGANQNTFPCDSYRFSRADAGAASCRAYFTAIGRWF